MNDAIMKVLILSITAGQGHNATGKAVSDYLKSQGVQCATLDTYEYAAPVSYTHLILFPQPAVWPYCLP